MRSRRQSRSTSATALICARLSRGALLRVECQHDLIAIEVEHTEVAELELAVVAADADRAGRRDRRTTNAAVVDDLEQEIVAASKGDPDGAVRQRLDRGGDELPVANRNRRLAG